MKYDLGNMNVVDRSKLVLALDDNRDSLSGSLRWEDTPQGRDFWFSIWEKGHTEESKQHIRDMIRQWDLEHGERIDEHSTVEVGDWVEVVDVGYCQNLLSVGDKKQVITVDGSNLHAGDRSVLWRSERFKFVPLSEIPTNKEEKPKAPEGWVIDGEEKRAIQFGEHWRRIDGAVCGPWSHQEDSQSTAWIIKPAIERPELPEGWEIELPAPECLEDMLDNDKSFVTVPEGASISQEKPMSEKKPVIKTFIKNQLWYWMGEPAAVCLSKVRWVVFIGAVAGLAYGGYSNWESITSIADMIPVQVSWKE